MTGSNIGLVILRFIRFGIAPFNHVQLAHYFPVEEFLPFFLALPLLGSLDRTFPSLLDFHALLLYLVPRLARKVVSQNAVVSAVPQHNLR